MSDRLDLVLGRAAAAGLLPASAVRPAPETRPWPVVLLTALGAWLAAIPLLIVVGLLLGDWISRGSGPYLVGALMLGGAVVVLRAREVPPFFEQLAVPALLVAGGSLGFGLFRDLPDRGAAMLLAALALAVALAIARPWLRVLLGAAAAGLLVSALTPKGSFIFSHHEVVGPWFGLHAVLALWLAALGLQRLALEDGARAQTAAAVESFAAGWLLTTLSGLAALSGMTFLLGGSFGGGLVAEVARELTTQQAPHGPLLSTGTWSALLALLACGLGARAWPGLRQHTYLPLAVVLVVLAWFLPTLGAVLLALSLAVTTQRYRQAAAAGLAAAWIAGSFYYQLHWPLATKALVLTACGAVLGVLAWSAHARDQRDARVAVAFARGPAWLLVLSALATLTVANVDIWQKEALIAHGQPVFVELAPVDPRSLMQGDYMRLNFRVPGEVVRDAETLLTPKRLRVVGRRDARGVATLLRKHHEGIALVADEFLVELTPKDGRWILVTDAWFFKEGEAQRWETAKFGEFRIDADGRALLVGLSDANLRAIQP